MRIWVHQAWWEERDVTLELFILSTEILATFAAISIFSMVSWTECFEPSLVFCLISSLKENWVNRYYSLGRKHESSFFWKKELNLTSTGFWCTCSSKRPDRSRSLDIAISWKALMKLWDLAFSISVVLPYFQFHKPNSMNSTSFLHMNSKIILKS